MIITFESELIKIGPLKLIKVPFSSSKMLSSRSMVMVEGTINDVDFKMPLEPDGEGSHWIEISPLMSEKLGIDIGDTLAISMEQSDQWIEPEVPEDIFSAINKANLLDQWNSLTPRSRWEWIRWIRSTKNSETRKKRIHTACSKLQNGDKNPCCFNSSLCTLTQVSKSGVLLDL